ncbi:MAG: leucine-rich repeat domain-containing protein, partial [Verrucomicrobiaceae bacterium]
MKNPTIPASPTGASRASAGCCRHWLHRLPARSAGTPIACQTPEGRWRRASFPAWFSFLMLVIQSAAAQAQDYSHVIYNGQATVTRYNGAGGAVRIPDTIAGFPVTRVGDGAFASCSTLTSVAIPDSVTSIGDNAFALCGSLTSISIPSQVTSIGPSAFTHCSGLTGVTFSNSSASIGKNAFNSCHSLTAINLGNRVTGIGGGAFASCVSLPGITIPASVAGIGSNAFASCSSLTDITVEAGNPYFRSEGGVLFDIAMTTLIKCPEAKQGSYTIPGGITNIGDYAFLLCIQMTAITIPDNVTSIGTSAFSGCASLVEVSIPAKVSSIRDKAFHACGSLMGITVAAANPAYCSVEGILFIKSKTALVQYPAGKPGSYSIPEGVIVIEASAFASSRGLVSVTLPESIEGIGSHAFDSCRSLTDITVHPANRVYSSAGGVLFYKDEGGAQLRCFPGGKAGHYRIPQGVTAILQDAFLDCPHVTGLTFPSSLGSIRDDAFGMCASLGSLYFEGDAPDLGDSSEFSNITATVYYMPGTMNWDETYGRRPARLWNPQVRTADASFGMKTDGEGKRFFAFNITGPADSVVLVMTSAGLSPGSWTILAAVTLADPDLDGIGSFHFSDPGASQYPA